MILGITGGSGCGKSTLLTVLEEQGCLVLDCDRIYHRLLESDSTLLCAIEGRFPGTVENGTLNRKKLGTIVFDQPDALADLNQITHSAVKAEVIRLLTPTPTLAAIEAIGLFESGLSALCQLTVAVTAPEEHRVQRLTARESVSQEYARSRIAAQHKSEEYEKLCDYTLVNDSTEAAFREKCLAFLQDRGIIKV